MRKLALVVGPLAAVVLLAVLVAVAHRGDEVTYRGSYEQLTEHPGKGHEHRGKAHDHRRHPDKPHHPRGHGHHRGWDASSALDLTCRVEDGRIVLSYTYGAGQRVAPFVDARGRDLVVGVEVDGPAPGTVVPSIGLLGEARFTLFGDPGTIRRSDGSDLPCPNTD